MSTPGKVTKVTLAQHVRDLIAGTQKHSPNGQLTLGGETFTAQALIQTLQSLGDALSTVDTAKASWKGALKNLTEGRRRCQAHSDACRKAHARTEAEEGHQGDSARDRAAQRHAANTGPDDAFDCHDARGAGPQGG